MRRPGRLRTGIAAVAGLLAAVTGCASATHTSRGVTTGTPASSPSATASPPAASPPVTSAPTVCPTGTTVATAKALQAALAAAHPGGVINVAPGSYTGNFVLSASGTASAPITVCGPRTALLDGGSTASGYVLHLNGASFVRVAGLTIRDGQKGVMVDRGQHDIIEGLAVTAIGDEGIHLRTDSSDNTVRGNIIRDTGRRKPNFGEGIYVGTAKSNWCRISNCQADRSDHNLIIGNDVAATTAESLDIKEGTTGGLAQDNVFSGAGIVPAAATAWLNAKGNSWLIRGNTGHTSPKDGLQVHQVLDGWGLNNVFHANLAEVDGPGYGIYVQNKRLGTVVGCDNKTVGAGRGPSNLPCS